MKPNPVDKLTDADLQNIDCLICHAEGYKRATVKEGNTFKLVPSPDIDVVKVAQSVRKPTNEMCLRCHTSVGGGPNHKHGVTPTKDADIHVAKGLHCVDCHTAKQHRMPGGSDLKVQDLPEVKVTCTNCHKEPVHKGKDGDYINVHAARIGCNTCHIPAIARDPKLPTITERDWLKPILNEGTGLYGPTNRFITNMKPDYMWWNGFMKIPPEPVGSLKDPKSKIFPWKRTTYNVIADAESGKAIFIHAGTYAITGDPVAAAKRGCELIGRQFSGKVKGVQETMVFSVNHQVAPKTEALKCNVCHSPKGVMDFKKLGYSDEQIKDLTTER